MKHLLLILIMAAFLLQCNDGSRYDSSETILVRIGDRTISKNEFLRRAEYTMRPVWCKGDNYIHRKIVLNSLIAEKLLAVEAEADGVILSNPEVQKYLQGRREQAMRRIHFHETAVKHARVDSQTQTMVMEMAQRRYEMEIIPLNDDALATEVSRLLQAGESDFDAIFEHLKPDSSYLEIPRKDFSFTEPLDDRLAKALFYSERQQGDIIGPLKMGPDNHLLLRVAGWTRRLPMGTEALQFKEDVKERLKEIKSRDVYEGYVKELMAGQSVEFNRPIFTELVNAVGPQYFKTFADKEAAFERRFWRADDEGTMVIDDIRSRVDKIRNQVLFTYNGKTWTVADFEEAIQVHPLVFRNRRMPQGRFGEEFKLAIVDMLRDFAITDEAYKAGLDKHPTVDRDVAMWRDNLLALYARNNLLQQHKTRDLNTEQTIENIIEPHLRELRERYADNIEINTDVFEETELTSIDMFVIQRNVPFPVIVPEFPQLTTHNRLDYGFKMVRAEQ